jgi:hypothetical protein
LPVSVYRGWSFPFRQFFGNPNHVKLAHHTQGNLKLLHHD